MLSLRGAAFLITVRALCAQQPDPTQLLLQAREKILSAVRRLPKYTCLETIDRSYFLAPPQPKGKLKLRAPLVDSCSAVKFQIPSSSLSLTAADRVRVEVAIAERDEIHSWPAARQFDTRPIDQMIPVGPTNSGTFGGNLVDIFNNPGATFRFTAKISGGRELFEYFFRVPLPASHFVVNGRGGWKETAFQGSFQIDTATAELVRLIAETDELPPEAAMCRAKATTEYRYSSIGDGQILLPSRSVLETLESNAKQTSSATTFSACHEFIAQSSIRFGAEDDTTASASSAPKRGTQFPPGILLTLALTNPIDPANAAGGDPISAKVTKAVRAPNSNTILIPAGAIARGRILQMRHQYDNSLFMIAIRFDTLESQGAVSPLSVRLTKLPARAGQRILPLSPDESGNLFSIPDKGGHVMKAGFESTWITVP
jgi:hypothetical protein